MQVVDKGEDYKVKVKKWLSTIVTADGDTRMKGENKKVMSYFIIVHFATWESIYLRVLPTIFACLLCCANLPISILCADLRSHC